MPLKQSNHYKNSVIAGLHIGRQDKSIVGQKGTCVGMKQSVTLKDQVHSTASCLKALVI